MVCEYPSGGRLEEKLAKGPLDLGAASRAVRDVARALTALHAAGVAHGAIGSDLVVFDEEGRAKLAAASFENQATTADDDAALGSLAWRTFTGTQPGAGRASKLPPTVADLLRRMISSDPVLRPRLREIDETLAPYARTTAPEQKASFLRQEARWLVPVLLLIGVGVAAVIVGLRVDLGPIQIGKPAEPKATPAPLAAVSVDDFDPHGSDRAENPRDVARAADGKEVSFWKTVNYRTARLGNAKPGVGLVFDLGSSRHVSRILVQSPNPGWKAEWRVAETSGATENDFAVVATFEAGESTQVPVPSGTGRYWLLWITQLARDTGGDPSLPFNAAVAEVQFFS